MICFGCSRTSTTHVLYVAMNCPPTTKTMSDGKNEIGKLKRRGKVLRMQFAVVNLCTSR